MLGFFKRKEEKRKRHFQRILQEMGREAFLLDKDAGMLYWKHNGYLTGTVAEVSGNKVVFDMGILDTWFYPEEVETTQLTKDERELFKEWAIDYLERTGYKADVEESKLEGTLMKRHRIR